MGKKGFSIRIIPIIGPIAYEHLLKRFKKIPMQISSTFVYELFKYFAFRHNGIDYFMFFNVM